MMETLTLLKIFSLLAILTKCNAIDCELPNEEFLSCGSECPKSCCNYNLNITCSSNCVSGCFCEPGYVRDLYGKCVNPKKCAIDLHLSSCGVNEEVALTGVGCEKTCSDGTNFVFSSENRCPCSPGFVRDARGQCILPGFCPQACLGYNEVFDCKTADTECTNLYKVIRRTQCRFGCFCKTDYARSFYGNCVPIGHCLIHNNPWLAHFLRQQALL